VLVLLGAVVAGAVPFAAAVAVAALVPAAVIDLEQRRLPDAWVGAAASILMAALAVGWVFGQPSDASVLRGALAGAIAMTLPVLVLHLVSPASMGFGDVKAAVVLGAAIGTVDWRLAPVALCLAALTGVAGAAITRARTIAFGPCLVFGAGMVLLLGSRIVDVVFQGGAR
jgi:leader peptidase (prepilin peptidase)/N-methyltransferase